MQFFSSDKRLQEILFQNHPPNPSPPTLKALCDYFRSWQSYICAKMMKSDLTLQKSNTRNLFLKN